KRGHVYYAFAILLHPVRLHRGAPKRASISRCYRPQKWTLTSIDFLSPLREGDLRDAQVTAGQDQHRSNPSLPAVGPRVVNQADTGLVAPPVRGRPAPPAATSCDPGRT